MSAFWLQVRSSSTRLPAIALTIFGLIFLLARDRVWVGIWPETGAAVCNSAFFMSLLCAGVLAWVAAKADARGLRTQTLASVPSQFVVEGTRLASALFWIVVSYLIVGTVAFGYTATSGQFPVGPLFFLKYIGVGAVLIFFSGIWGWFVGRILPPMVAGLVAALSWFLAVSVIGDRADMAPVSGPVWLNISGEAIGIRLGGIALAAVLICLIPVNRPWVSGRRKAIVFSATALALAFGTQVSTQLLSQRPPVAEPRCVSGAMEYCLWPENAKYVPMVNALDDRVRELPVKLTLPKRVVDYSLSGKIVQNSDGSITIRDGKFDPEFKISGGSKWALARGVARAIVDTMLKDCDADAPDDPARSADQFEAWLEWRLAGDGKPDYITTAPKDLQDAWAAGSNVVSSSEAVQAAWAKRVITETLSKHCHAP